MSQMQCCQWGLLFALCCVRSLILCDATNGNKEKNNYMKHQLPNQPTNQLCIDIIKRTMTLLDRKVADPNPLLLININSS
jgi:hypothetical protein